MKKPEWIGNNQFDGLTLEERFWQKVDKRGDDECWEWRGHLLGNGYGGFWINNKEITSHRVSWVMHYGEIPKGLCVCHECDNRICVNPNHLHLGTQKENMIEASRRNRICRRMGDENPNSKITQAIATEIRSQYILGGTSTRKLAVKFGISQNTVMGIISNKRWIAKE